VCVRVCHSISPCGLPLHPRLSSRAAPSRVGRTTVQVSPVLVLTTSRYARCLQDKGFFSHDIHVLRNLLGISPDRWHMPCLPLRWGLLVDLLVRCAAVGRREPVLSLSVAPAISLNQTPVAPVSPASLPSPPQACRRFCRGRGAGPVGAEKDSNSFACPLAGGCQFASRCWAPAHTGRSAFREPKIPPVYELRWRSCIGTTFFLRLFQLDKRTTPPSSFHGNRSSQEGRLVQEPAPLLSESTAVLPCGPSVPGDSLWKVPRT